MPPTSFIDPLPTRAERKAAGTSARDRAPLADQARFEPGPDRDPVGLLLEQSTTRVPDLVPIRHARMLVSPFTFFRGAALPMAADLAASPHSGLTVQLCGDAHLSNFGAFASPERRLVFDINDFDETLPGPFEWDVKRLAASVVVAARDNGFSDKAARRAAKAGVASYREAMRDFARTSILDVWGTVGDIEARLEEFRGEVLGTERTSGKKPGKKARKRVVQRLSSFDKAMAKARRQDSTRAARKLTEIVDGHRRIVADPPLIVPLDQMTDQPAAERRAFLESLLEEYRLTLSVDRRDLLGHFALRDVAHKVVGVGSVGTRAWILLLEADDGDTPLILQAKQAEASVLSRFLAPSEYENQGRRVVVGQRATQAASDVFLGWVRAAGFDGVPRDFYVRQLKDWKASADIATLGPDNLLAYARICGWTLARAHAKTGDRVAIASYLGGSERFDDALTDFAVAYADQTVRDHAALSAAVASGRAQAAEIGTA